MTTPAQPTHIARYLNELPNGLASYPECLASVDVVNALRARYPKLAAHAKLTPSVASMLSRPVPNTGYLPEVHCMTHFLALRDTFEFSDQAVIQGAAKDAANVLDGPLMRHLWRVLSPSLMIMGCQKRWSSLHQGTQLTTVESTQHSATLRLMFPPRLFNLLMLKCFAAGMEQALLKTRVASHSVTVESVTETSCLFVGQWS